jgi:hypothetical protein
VARVIDGDTIEVEINGQGYKVRYIGVNTPEVGEPFYAEAAEANRRLVEGRVVELEKDVSETDRHGRLLRYVYVGETMINAELVSQGYAQAVTYPPDVKYQDLFLQLQQEAREAGRGLWVTVTAPRPTQPPASPSPTDTPAPAGPSVIIVTVDKKAEYVDIKNTGGAPQDLAGWHLLSERGAQDCPLGGVIQPGETLRIWVLAEDAGQEGYNCGFGSHIWNNAKPDAAVLYDAAGHEIDRKP